MRIAAAGPYLMVKKFGIEGLLTIDESQRDNIQIESNPEQEKAQIVFRDGSREPIEVRVFNNLKVQIRAEMVEYRRTV